MTQTTKEYRLAGFWVRAAAFLIDRALLWIALLIVRLPGWIGTMVNGGGSRAVFFRFTPADIFCWLLITAYFIAMTYCKGATLGKMAMKLRVLNSEGERPSLLTVFYREIVGRYLSSILCIGYLIAAFHSEHLALHDLICDTRVVYDPEKMPKAGFAEKTAEGTEAPATASPDEVPGE